MTDNLDEFYEAWAREGSFSELDQLEFEVTKSSPLVGSHIVIRWCASGGVHPVAVFKDGRPWLQDQAITGDHHLLIEDLTEIRLRAVFGELDRELLISPQVEQPQFGSLDISAAVKVNEPILIRYSVTGANRVEVLCEESTSGYSQLQILEVCANNHCSFITSAQGDYRITLRACSQHACLSEQGIKTFSQRVQVRYSAPLIKFLKREQRKAMAGNQLRLNWATENASQVWFEDASGTRLQVQPQGEMIVEAPPILGAVRYRLLAINPSGEQTSQETQVLWEIPKQSLSLSVSRKLIGLGDRVKLNWQLKYSRQWWIEVHSGGEAYRLNINESQGQHTLKIGRDAEFKLVSLGFDGAKQVKSVKVRVGELPYSGDLDAMYKGLRYLGSVN